MNDGWIQIHAGVPGADIRTYANPVPVPPQVRQEPVGPERISVAMSWDKETFFDNVERNVELLNKMSDSP